MFLVSPKKLGRKTVRRRFVFSGLEEKRLLACRARSPGCLKINYCLYLLILYQYDRVLKEPDGVSNKMYPLAS